MRVMLAVILLTGVLSVHAQGNIKYRGTIRFLFETLHAKYGYQFMYSNEDVDDTLEVDIEVDQRKIEEILLKFSDQFNVHYEIKGKQIILKKRNRVIPEKKLQVNRIEKRVITSPLTSRDLLPDTFILPNTPFSMDIIHSDIAPKPLKYEKERYIKWSIHLNVPAYFLLTPNVGIGMTFKNRVGVLLGGSWAHWNWSNKDKTYRLWDISGEIRYFFSPSRDLYTGLLFRTGELNLKLDKTGRQGKYAGGGILLGYIVNINRHITIDIATGLGYIVSDYEKYSFRDQMNIFEGARSKNRLLPVKCDVSLVWNFLN